MTPHYPVRKFWLDLKTRSKSKKQTIPSEVKNQMGLLPALQARGGAVGLPVAWGLSLPISVPFHTSPINPFQHTL